MKKTDPTAGSSSPWPKDQFARHERASQIWFVIPWAIIGLTIVMATVATRFSGSGDHLVLYAAQDQVYAEPIVKEFERLSAVKVLVVYDSEAVKTVGLANRLIAEQRNPQCDVFWGNEELRTRQLAARGLFRETNGWAAFGYRSRRMARRSSSGETNGAETHSWRDLTNAAYQGRIALAYPLFGSTTTHFLALRQQWGEADWLAWCRSLAANRPLIVDGNSVAVQFLIHGQVDIALTDSDDIAAAVREGARIQPLPMDQNTLLIPNTVAIVRHCRHAQAAEKLFAYLQTRAVSEKLIACGALEGESAGVTSPSTLHPHWDAVLRDLDVGMDQLKEIFRK